MVHPAGRAPPSRASNRTAGTSAKAVTAVITIARRFIRRVSLVSERSERTGRRGYAIGGLVAGRAPKLNGSTQRLTRDGLHPSSAACLGEVRDHDDMGLLRLVRRDDDERRVARQAKRAHDVRTAGRVLTRTRPNAQVPLAGALGR